MEDILVVRGELVRRRRVKLGLSQVELADATNTTQQTISRIEAGASDARDYLKHRIAEELGVKVRALFPYADDTAEEIEGEMAWQ